MKRAKSKISTFIKVLILKIIYYDTLPFFDYIIGISEGIVKEAKRFGAKKIVKIPILINSDYFFSKSGGPKNISPDSNNATILFVGQIKKVKGIHTLIEALHALKKEDNLAPKLLIAGDITSQRDLGFYQELKNAAKGLNVEFLGWIDHQNLPEVYQRADIFVLPSFSEGLGMVTMEAMASGLPVIATKTSGAKDLVKDGETGFLVPVGDPVSIKEKILVLLKNPELKKSMGENGRKRIEEFRGAVDREYKKLWQDLGL